MQAGRGIKRSNCGILIQENASGRLMGTKVLYVASFDGQFLFLLLRQLTPSLIIFKKISDSFAMRIKRETISNKV